MFTFLHAHLAALGLRLAQHIYLSLVATLVAIGIGVPLGIFIKLKPKAQHTVLAITNIFQTIPSLALLAFLVPFLGIGVKPTITTLTVYALLPITRNTLTGLQSVPAALIEAANGLGFTCWQRLFKVEIPLAMPIIIAGIRTATAMTIGITTIAAFIGAGGLGDFITQGLSLDSSKLILLGAVPTALLALLLDYLIAMGEKAYSCRKPTPKSTWILRIIVASLIAISLCYAMGYAIYVHYRDQRSNTIVIGSKNFTEEFILANLMADLIRADTHLNVALKLNMGTSTILQNAMLSGAIDAYPEYTGTAYLVILKNKKIVSAAETYDIVKREYKKRFKLIWLKPFGYNNSQTLAVSNVFAKQHHLTNLSELAAISPQLTLAAPAEFLKRPDGLPGLQRVYGLKFKSIVQMQPDLMYRAIYNKDVNVIEVFTTDARIDAFHLTALKDNKHFYPPYYAAPIIRQATLKAHPKLRQVLNQLAGKINFKTMRRLNYKVDILHQPPAKVAKQFLIKIGLLHPLKSQHNPQRSQ